MSIPRVCHPAETIDFRERGSVLKTRCRVPSVWIALGGALGALLRHGIERLSGALAASDAGFPWATFGINLSGAFVLGWVLSRAESGAPGGEWLRCFAGIGFCGAFTTFSTMNAEMVELAQAGSLPLAAVYFIASFVFGIVASALGAGIGMANREARS